MEPGKRCAFHDCELILGANLMQKMRLILAKKIKVFCGVPGQFLLVGVSHE
jgi:hypothetical protein